MPARVVVALDPDKVDTAALAWAVDWARLTAAELVTVAVQENELLRSKPESRQQLSDAVHAAINKRVVEVGGPELAHRCRVEKGEPRQVIISVANEEDAAVVVIGSRGGGGFDGLGLGGVAHQVCHDIRRPVVVVPAGAQVMQGHRVVVGVDGSAACEPALAWAVEAARALGGGVEALYAHDPLADSYPHGPASNWRYRGEDDVRKQVAAFANPEVPIDVVLVGDNPVSALTRAADQAGAAVTVVGTRGFGGFKGLVLGRTAAQIAHHAHGAVAIIHH